MKVFIISFLVAGVFIGGIMWMVIGGSSVSNSDPTNVTMVDGKQIIEINAKGTYWPKNTIAKANIPTIIKVKTNNTYDCTSRLTIPQIGYRTQLPLFGETNIAINPQESGSKIKGVCTMGMYSFTVNFN